MFPIPLAQNSPEVIARNLHWLAGFWARVILLLVGCFALWMAVRMLEWRRLARKAQREAEAAKLGPDGKPLPPAAGGLCDRCGQVYDKVYYLPGGGRRCPGCYEKDLS